MDNMHLKDPSFDLKALLFPFLFFFFHLAIVKAQFSEKRYDSKWPLCANVPLNHNSFIYVKTPSAGPKYYPHPQYSTCRCIDLQSPLSVLKSFPCLYIFPLNASLDHRDPYASSSSVFPLQILMPIADPNSPCRY